MAIYIGNTKISNLPYIGEKKISAIVRNRSDITDQYMSVKRGFKKIRYATDSLSFTGSNIYKDHNENIILYANELGFQYNEETKEFDHTDFIDKLFKSINGSGTTYFWSDGTFEYFSFNGTNTKYQYKKNPTSDLWTSMTWGGLANFYGYDIWTDGENIYCSKDYVLNKATNTWESKTWNGIPDEFSVSCIWTDGENIYYSNGDSSTQYVLDKATSTWTKKTWSGLTSLYGHYIWTDGDNVYYSNNRNQYVLDKATSTWSKKTWSGLTRFYGYYVWCSKKGDVYYSNGTSHYVLNKATSTWTSKTWVFNDFGCYGQYIWSDGNNIYYSKYKCQYVLNKTTNTWSQKTWSGLTTIYGDNIWTDGENIYHSNGGSSTQYVLDKATSTWSKKTWSGLTTIYGMYIWSDGNNIYYSNGATQYVLDKATSTWTKKTWSGLTSFNGLNIWTDGIDIYVTMNSNNQLYNYRLINGNSFEEISIPGIDDQLAIDTGSVFGRMIYNLSDGAYLLNDMICYKFDSINKKWVGFYMNRASLEYAYNFAGTDTCWTDGTNFYTSSCRSEKYGGGTGIYMNEET